MEALKNCSTCYWAGYYKNHNIERGAVCGSCELESSPNNVFPSWEPVDAYDEEERVEDVVNHPKHYTVHPSGVECIQITEHMNFCLGNAMKYIWRAGDKHETPIEDLKKAKWYIEREIKRLEKE